jgi:hypothetical protein
MVRAWDSNMRNAIITALNRLRTFDKGKFSQADSDIILKTLENYVGAQAMTAALHGPVLNISETLYELGFVEIGKANKLDVSFRHADLDAINVIQNANLFWIGNSWNSHTNRVVKNVLVDYFQQGLSRQQVTSRFAQDFAGLTRRNQHYWEMLADHTATRTREIGRVGAYEAAEVEYVQVRAQSLFEIFLKKKNDLINCFN